MLEAEGSQIGTTTGLRSLDIMRDRRIVAEAIRMAIVMAKESPFIPIGIERDFFEAGRF